MKSRSNKNYFQEEILDPCIHLENRVRKKLIRRYDKPLWYHDVKMINDIIYNEKTHFVELFKEYLIYEDINEFLKRFYNINEISLKLPRILLFYEKYSKIYANYTVIPESKYMYKNIKRKQKMIDQMQNNNDEDDEEEEEEGEDLPNIIFNTKAMNSINSYTMSIYGNDSISKNSKTETSVNNLLNKIDDYERNAQKIKVRNKNNRKSNNVNNLNKNKLMNHNTGRSNNHLFQKNTIIQLGDSISRRVISAIFSPNTKLNNNHYKNSKNKNANSQNKKNKMALKDNNMKDNKIIMSTMSAVSPKILTSRIFSPSGPTSNKNIKKKKKYISPTISNNNSRRESNIRKIFSNPLTKNLKNQKENYNSKLFSNKNDFLKKKKSTIINSNCKSKSNSKNKENNSIINNYNIVNNIQSGSTQINIYTGNELINSLHLHANSVFNSSNFNNRTSKSPVHRKNNSNNMTYNSKQKSISKPKKQKFDLNLRKIIHKQIVESEASSDKNNINKNFFEKLGKYFSQLNKNNENKINSTSINKFSINESKLIAKVINKHPSYGKINQKFSNEKNSLSDKCNKIKTNNQTNNSLLNNNSIVRRIGSNSNFKNDKLTLKNIHDLNKLLKGNNNFTLHSERGNKTRINFK